MDNEETKWVRWVALAFCVLVVTIGGCQMHENYLIKESIRAGASPIAASCAIAPQFQTAGECTIVATKQ